MGNCISAQDEYVPAVLAKNVPCCQLCGEGENRAYVHLTMRQQDTWIVVDNTFFHVKCRVEQRIGQLHISQTQRSVLVRRVPASISRSSSADLHSCACSDSAASGSACGSSSGSLSDAPPSVPDSPTTSASPCTPDMEECASALRTYSSNTVLAGHDGSTSSSTDSEPASPQPEPAVVGEGEQASKPPVRAVSFCSEALARDWNGSNSVVWRRKQRAAHRQRLKQEAEGYVIVSEDGSQTGWY